MDDLISRQAAIDALNLADDRGEIRSAMDAIGTLKALPTALPTLDEVYTEREQAYMAGYEQGGRESIAAMLNAFKCVRDELPLKKREGYTDRFCELVGKMLDELERTDD